MYDKFRTILPEDITKANDWLEYQGMNRIPEDMYPETGIIMQDEYSGEGIYVGFLWMTNSKLAQVGFIARNTQYKKTNRREQSLKIFVNQLLLYAKDLGYSYIATWAQDINLVNCFKEIGFTEASNRTSELIAKIE
jgi:hypothetical protein